MSQKNRADRSSQPNILLLVPDSLRADALGCMGNAQVVTPNMDRLAQEGAVFTQSFAACAPCMPSRASIFTGRSMRSHGVWVNGASLPPGIPTLATILREAGYATGAFGKMHLVPEKPQVDGAVPYLKAAFGFQHHALCEDVVNAGPYRTWLASEFPEFADKFGSGPPVADGATGCYESLFPLEAHPVTWITDRVIEWIETHAGRRPFFAMVGFHEPHYPFKPPEPFVSMYEGVDPDLLPRREGEMEDKPPHFRARALEGVGDAGLAGLTDAQWKTVLRRYWGQVSLVDSAVGRMLDGLTQLGIEQDTLVLCTSDHGLHVGDHGLIYSCAFHYDGFIRVPLVCRWPGQIPAGVRPAEFVQGIDILPTILSAAGAAAPSDVHGIDLLAATSGSQRDRRDAVLVEQCSGPYDARHPEKVALSLETLRTQRYRLTSYLGESFGELYDLETDPNEFVNLWDAPEAQQVKAQLLNRLLAEVMRAGPSLPRREAQW